MKWFCALALMTSLTAQDSPELWRKYAEKLTLGSAVSVRAAGGPRFTAVLLAVDETGVTVRPKARVPEPYRRIPYEQLQQLEPYTGASYAQRLAVGTAVGFGITYAFFAMLMAGMR